MALEINTGEYRGIEKIPTAVDERGIVDPVKTTIECMDLLQHFDLDPHTDTPEDTHHLLWPRSWYVGRDITTGKTTACSFRNLSIHTVEYPRGFHEKVHQYTLPPEILPHNFMRKYMSSHYFMHRMFQKASLVVSTQRKINRILEGKPVDESKFDLLSLLSSAYQSLEIAKFRYEQVPIDARVMPELDLDLGENQLAGKIGKLTIGRQGLVRFALG